MLRATYTGGMIMKYDVIIIGAGPGGIFAAYELAEQDPTMRVAVIEAGEYVHPCFRCQRRHSR